MSTDGVKLSGTDDSGGTETDRLEVPVYDTATIPGRSLARSLFETDEFVRRHIGPSADDVAVMLKAVGVPSIDDLLDETLPASIRSVEALGPPDAVPEHVALDRLRTLAKANATVTSLIGMGYTGTITPAGDRPQRAGEPGVVHGVHAVPARDQPGPPRGDPQLPDRSSPN